jgi:uncharacterized protein YqhQ
MLIHIIIALAVLGLVWFLFARYILPLLPAPLPTILTVLFVVVICIWLLESFGGVGLGRL